MNTALKHDIGQLLKKGVLHIDTDKSKETTDAFCKDMEPWRVVMEFSNGTSTTEFEKNDFMYNRIPLGKMRIFSQYLDMTQFQNKNVQFSFQNT